MRIAIRLAGACLLLVSMAWVSCAPVQKTILTKDSLSTIKGTWRGWTTFSSVPSVPVRTTLRITNDTVPVQGSITLEHLPEGAASVFPADAKTAGGDVTIDFKNGMISDQGTLIGQSGQNFLELTYYAAETLKFEGWFYYYGAKGTVELTKK